MSDTPTPQELARSLKAAWSNHALHHLSDETVVQIAAALERLARVEQPATPRRVWDDEECAAFVKRLHHANQDDHAVCLRQLLKRLHEVEQERDASDAAIASACGHHDPAHWKAIEAAIERHHAKQKTGVAFIDLVDDVNAVITRHRAKQKTGGET